MKNFLLLIVFLFSATIVAQSEQLAQNYFEKGEFEKAVVSFGELHERHPSNSVFFQRLIESHQQLQQYDKAEDLIRKRLDKFKQGSLYVELGYNYQLRNDHENAKKNYDEAFNRIRKSPTEAYSIAPAFETRSLLQQALDAYTLAAELNPKLHFNYKMALLHGQMGNLGLMIGMLLDEAHRNPHSSIMVQNQLARFMMGEDGETAFSESLRKALLLRAQKDQDVFWNEYLSWFFVQQKEYGKAFVQEKAVYRRNAESLANIVNLAQLAIDENDAETAKEILEFVLQNTQDAQLLVQAHEYLTRMRIDAADAKEYAAIDQHLQGLLAEFGITPYSLPLQILQAHFVTFNLNDASRGKSILQRALELNMNRYQEADVKMELADIFLYEQKFNQALLYYSQIEEDLKNDAIGHQASLKAAKTSYFKADFKWAMAQFKTLKSASSQLIANDALEYFLLLNDNTVADSTQTALTKFAHADYLLYQNKNAEALSEFKDILATFKGEEIEAVTLLRLGRTSEKLGDHTSALEQYKQIIDNHADGIYVDEALYHSAEIHRRHLKDPEKAKALYEQLLFNHADSIFFIEARKKFRELRGDTTL